jgi:hypothetical protein
MLAKNIGCRACRAHHRGLFTTAMDMLNHLLASQASSTGPHAPTLTLLHMIDVRP